jgi:PPOX class probable F420-dependent enzyme
MTNEQISTFIEQQRTATLATIGPAGLPHLVAMWFAVIDGSIWFETKQRSQKAANLRRDPRLTVLIESGNVYGELRGVSLEGRARVVDDPEALWAVGVNLWERYNGPFSEATRPAVEQMIHNRVAVQVRSERIRSWDHRHLGLEPTKPSGSTAAFLSEVHGQVGVSL